MSTLEQPDTAQSEERTVDSTSSELEQQAAQQQSENIRAHLDRLFGNSDTSSPAGWGGGKFSAGTAHGFGC